MATDADTPGPQSSHARQRTDRQSAGRSVDVTPETLYLTRMAVQQARIDALESTVERQERDLQHVIDRYEHLLAAREPAGEQPLTDGGREADDAHSTSGGVVARALAPLRRLF